MKQPFSVFDIESNNWKDFLILGYYDGNNFTTHNSIEDFMQHLFSCDDSPSTCYAHFGGIFDFLFVLDFLFTKNGSIYSIQNLILQGRKILKFDVTFGRQKIAFVDSSGLFPFSLDKLTTAFDVKHKKITDSIDFSKKLRVTKKLLKYLEHDCLGLYESLQKFAQLPYIKGSKLSLTRSGQSFQVFKEHFQKDLPYIPPEAKEFARQAYFGGRTEIFKPLYQNKRPLNVYDINSLYPSVMHDFEYPSKFIGFTSSVELDSFSISDVTVHIADDIYCPILGIRYNGKFIFPTGTFRGHFTNIELNFALSRGYSIVECHRTALFDNGGYFFKPFVKHFYEARKETSDPVKKILYKDILNHLYGRLAIQELREQITLKPSDNTRLHSTIDRGDHEIRLYSEEKFIHTYSNPVLSCFVTSYARLRLYAYMERVNFNIYYCDTDSIFTPEKMDDNFELGEMKLEYQLKEACFLLPKSYAGIKLDDSILMKLKGFSNTGQNKDAFSHISFNDFVECLSGNIRLAAIKQKKGLAGLKTALRKGEILSVLPTQTKQLKAKYDKREIYKKGKKYDTRPLHLEYQLEMKL